MVKMFVTWILYQFITLFEKKNVTCKHVYVQENLRVEFWDREEESGNWPLAGYEQWYKGEINHSK